MSLFRFLCQMFTPAFSRHFLAPLCMLFLSRISLFFFSWSFCHDIVYARAQAAMLRFYAGYWVKEIAKCFNKIPQEIRETDNRRLGQFYLFTGECPEYLFQFSNKKKPNIVWGLQEWNVCRAIQVKQSAKAMLVCGGGGESMTGHGLTNASHKWNLNFWVLH